MLEQIEHEDGGGYGYGCGWGYGYGDGWGRGRGYGYGDGDGVGDGRGNAYSRLPSHYHLTLNYLLNLMVYPLTAFHGATDARA